VVHIEITGGRRETLYCVIVWAMTGWGGVPNQRVGAQRIILIRDEGLDTKQYLVYAKSLGRVGAHVPNLGYTPETMHWRG